MSSTTLTPDRAPANAWQRLTHPAETDPQAISKRRWWTLAVLNLSHLLIVMDNTVLNVALPTLSRELGASAGDLQWIVDAYVLVFAGLLLSAGALGDRFGRRGALSSGLVVMGLGSLVAMTASSAGTLISARAIMGIGGALIMPTTLSILTNVFTDPKERAKAIGLWATVGGVAMAIGPVTGGWLLEHFSWKAIFLANIPVVVVALAAGRSLVPTSRDPETPPLDIPGAVLSIAGLGSLVWTIISAGEHGWTSATSAVGFAAAAVLLATFVGWERRAAHPMLDVSFFRNRRFTAASLSVMLGYFAMFGALFLMTQLLQFVLGFSALQAGIRVLPFALAMSVFAPVSPKLVERLGTKFVVSAGLGLAAAGLLWASQIGVGGTYADYLPSMLLMGTGIALTWAPTTEAIMGSLPAAKAGVGSAVNDTVREVGGALGVAVLGSVLVSRYGAGITASLADVPQSAGAHAGDSIGGAAVAAEQIGGTTGAALLDAAEAAFLDGFGSALSVAAGVAMAGAVLAAIWLPARPVAPATTDEATLRSEEAFAA